MPLFRRLMQDEDGQGLVEYGLILALIAIAIIVVLTTMGDKIKTLFTKANSTVHESADAQVSE